MSSPQKFTHDLLSPFLIDKRDAEVQLEDVDGLEDQLADKAAVSHTHEQSDVVGLVSALAGKSAVGHGHTTSDISDFASAVTAISDPWTYVKLGSDFTTSSDSDTSVTGLNFTPAASKTYLVDGMFLLRTATATVGPRPGVSWPAGYSDGAAMIDAADGATALAVLNAPVGTAGNAASTGLPGTTESYPARLQSTLVMGGGSPSGNFQITLASETAGTDVTMRAGSWIRYREI